MSDPQTLTNTTDETTRRDALATLMAPYSVPNPENARTPEEDAA